MSIATTESVPRDGNRLFAGVVRFFPVAGDASGGEVPAMTITIYCASSEMAPSAYGAAAFRLGELCAQEGVTVVFGGGGIGSMGRLADGVLAAGGRIRGVMPRFMRELEWAHPGVRDLDWTEDMASRKHAMLANADALVALPGGCGTFEELLEAVTLKRLGVFTRPIVIVNQEGFYDPLIALFDRAIADRFMDARHRAMWTVVPTVDEVFAAIEQAPRWDASARSFACVRQAPPGTAPAGG
jgi:uncharacterized protein (TIGR00730 family)